MELIFLGQLITVAIGAFIAGWWFKRGQFENKIIEVNSKFETTMLEVQADIKQELLNSQLERDESIKQQISTTKIIEIVRSELISMRDTQKKMTKQKNKNQDVQNNDEPEFIKADSNETD